MVIEKLWHYLLSKHWRLLAFWLSLCFGSFLLFLVCHDTAFLFSTRAMTALGWLPNAHQNLDSDPKEAWHYNHVTFTPIAKNFMLYCRLIYMLSMLYVRLTIKVKVGIPESFKVRCYPHKITGSSHLKLSDLNEMQRFCLGLHSHIFV